MSARDIAALAGMARKPHRTILGLMSGTSLDGLDMALCRFSGSGTKTGFELLHFDTAPYTDAFRKDILSIFARRDIDLEMLTLLHRSVAERHAEMVLCALRDWGVAPAAVDAMASHGQTIYHAPASLHGRPGYPDATLQIGDGDHLAVRSGIVTISDFRQKHLAGGGEGAPLATYGDLLLLSSDDEARLLLNVGGIANFTYLPPLADEMPAFSSDIGPGNTLMDAYIRKHFAPESFDRDAALARQGGPHRALVESLRSESFFAAPFPKTTGPELFSLGWFEACAATIAPRLSHADAMATLNRFSAETIADAARRASTSAPVYASGGGARNPLLMRHLAELLPDRSIGTTAELGLDPDAKEAVLFAALANECLAGSGDTFRGRIKGAPAITMGKISLPS